MKKPVTLIAMSICLLLSTGVFADAVVNNVPLFRGGLTQAAEYQQGAEAIKYSQCEQMQWVFMQSAHFNFLILKKFHS